MLPFQGDLLDFIIKIPRRCLWVKHIKGFQPLTQNKTVFP